MNFYILLSQKIACQLLEHCQAVFVFYLTARIRLNLIRAVEIFLSSSRDFEKKCRAVEIQADAFRAVHPDSAFTVRTNFKKTWLNNKRTGIRRFKFHIVKN